MVWNKTVRLARIEQAALDATKRNRPRLVRPAAREASALK
jgi:hypothetical protein